MVYNRKAYNRKYYRDHKGEIIAHNREYRQDNKDKINASQKIYYEDHKNEVIAHNRKYYQDHKSKIITYNTEYYQTHKDAILKQRKEYDQGIGRDEVLKKQKEYRQNHRDVILKGRKKYYQTHKDEIVKKTNEYRQTHKDEIRKHKQIPEVRDRIRECWRRKSYIERWSQTTISSHRRLYTVNITWKELMNFAKTVTNCPLCSHELNWESVKKKKEILNSTPSLDRIDNGNIIDLEHCWIICHSCNVLKRNKTLSEFLIYCKTILSNQGYEVLLKTENIKGGE